MSEQDRAASSMNDSGTGREIGTSVTRPRSPPVPQSKVYFIRSGDAIKIGVSINPEQRFGGLQVGSALELDLIGVMPGTMETEKQLHARFEHLHIRGEWFHADKILLDFIDSAIQRPAEGRPLPPPIRRQQPTKKLGPTLEALAVIGGLIRVRESHGAHTPIGHCCSLIVEQIREMANYVRPEWAKDERQTLPWMLGQSMNRLARLKAALN